MNLGTWLFTRLHGQQVGTDPAGNNYYTERKPRPGLRVRRWVDFAGPPEASVVPPEWHAWLHYTTDAPLPELARELHEKYQTCRHPEAFDRLRERFLRSFRTSATDRGEGSSWSV